MYKSPNRVVVHYYYLLLYCCHYYNYYDYCVYIYIYIYIHTRNTLLLHHTLYGCGGAPALRDGQAAEVTTATANVVLTIHI